MLAATLVVEEVVRRAEETPSKTAIIEGDHRISYAELVDKIVMFASLLHEMGGIANDRILLGAKSERGFIYSYLGCHMAGMVAVPIDSQTPKARVAEIEKKVVSKFSFLNMSEVDSILENAAPAKVLSQISRRSDELADILFTSGTTGTPKGVMLSHTNLVAAVNNINSFIGNTEEDIEALIMPLSHSFGLGRMRCTLSAGGTLVLINGLQRPKLLFTALKDEKVTGIGMVPSAWYLLEKLTGRLLAKFANQIKYIELGSAPMTIESKESLLACLPNTRICMHYGLTEASRAVFLELNSTRERLETIGKPAPNVEVEIRGADGSTLPVGEEGELCVRGEMVTQGYLDDRARTASSFWGGFFRTGDRAVIDGEGFIRLVGREKEMINVGGKKVAPIEVESVVKQFSSILDCACVGIEDGISGEAIVAFVVCDNRTVDVPGLKQFLGDYLESYKIPSRYEVVEEIPMTPSGKIQRVQLKEGLS